MPIQYKIIGYRKGCEMRTDHCEDWMQAEEIAAEMMQMRALYDEVRIIRVGEDKQ